MRNKRGSVLCLGLVAAMMLFASSLQALPLTSQVYAVAAGHAQTQGLGLQQNDEPALSEVYRKKFTTFFNNNAEVLWRNGVNKNDLLFNSSWSTPVVGTTTLTSHVSGCTLLEMRASHE